MLLVSTIYVAVTIDYSAQFINPEWQLAQNPWKCSKCTYTSSKTKGSLSSLPELWNWINQQYEMSRASQVFLSSTVIICFMKDEGKTFWACLSYLRYIFVYILHSLLISKYVRVFITNFSFTLRDFPLRFSEAAGKEWTRQYNPNCSFRYCGLILHSKMKSLN